MTEAWIGSPLADYLALAAGVACAGAGGELFVRGTVGLAQAARVSPGMIGATVAAFATSSPELSVSISAASAGRPQIALGDALGSNVVNVALILALALLVAAAGAPRGTRRRDLPVALFAPVLTGILVIDGVLSAGDGLVLLAVFAAWLAATVRDARRQRSAAPRVLGEPRAGRAAALCAGGLVLLVGAGQLVVAAGTGIAAALGVDEFLVGATIVALGTSTPELATAVVAMFRRHAEVALGTIFGSNLFNGLFIAPVAALIHPIGVAPREAAVALGFGFAAVVLALPDRRGVVGRWRGLVLLALYGAYLAVVAAPSRTGG